MAAVALFAGAATAAPTVLQDYVARADAATRWEKHDDERSRGLRTIDAEIVSQTWRGTTWKHALRLTVPEAPRHQGLAILIIGEDGRRAFLDQSRLAAEAGVPVALVGSVPNQPLFGFREDALIAYTFEQYLRTREPDWPVLFPMTKAAVRAMDAVADLLRREAGMEVDRFVVTGASKRGWTTWLTAVADHRVAGIAPVVFDNLNFGPQMKNQMAVWKSYSPELADYSERSLQALIGTDRGRELVGMVDPFSYREALARIPKLVINGSNDPYWELDAVNLYWHELPGAKSLLSIANAGHGAGGDPRVVATLAAFAERIAESRPMPELRWDGETIRSDADPAEVRVWRAESASRDFRSARWRALEARRQGDRFVAGVAAPPRGYAAFFGEADYASGERSFTVSTPVRILAGTTGP